MQPRFAGRLGAADAVTAGNAALGFCAVAAAAVSPRLAARLVLLAAILDAVDGLLARRYGGTDVGPYLDSLADVASFGVAPAAVVVAVARSAWGSASLAFALAVIAGAVFVGMAVVRLALYTAHDVENAHTEGVPSTLAGTIIAVGVLAGFTSPVGLVALTVALAALMVTTRRYPDLRPRHALVMGAVQAVVVLFPRLLDGLFPRVLLAFAVAYLVFGPRVYARRE
ncbi:protein sorting system archaetidylserine synthase [Halocalculus aciditolerans]|uniref:CDP-diacylglycerol--serine O-phosphatidyltransferase n=1 Tax=Halocalculus aciditolerans TaxID=1383812 RepID=A0A830F467_9EURY|nr:protein sorting system archaetidylserine synthase [Halocalculus aciditolerans]GGL61044.1 hypothetical protein GCM10009039_18990 [Halocalculus aciditolerans]